MQGFIPVKAKKDAPPPPIAPIFLPPAPRKRIKLDLKKKKKPIQPPAPKRIILERFKQPQSQRGQIVLDLRKKKKKMLNLKRKEFPDPE